jgi:hypothetical protein
MLNVKVDRGDPSDLYEQVSGEIRRAIAEGEAKPGERLPRRVSPRQRASRGERAVPPRPSSQLDLPLRAENLDVEDAVAGEIRSPSRPPTDRLPVYEQGPTVDGHHLLLVRVARPPRAAGDRLLV